MAIDKFDDEYVNQLIRIALMDKNILELLKQFLKPEYLPTDGHKKLWKAILTEYDHSPNKALPSLAVIGVYFRKDLELRELITDIKQLTLDDKDDILRALEDFIRQNMFVEIFEQLGDLYNKGKKNESYALFKDKSEAFLSFSLKNKTFEKVFEGFNRRISEREIAKIEGNKREKIPTGIDELDRELNGGPETGELVIIIGDSGVGKSFLGNHIGINAARRGKPVLHVQAEGTKEQVMNRYDSAFTGTRYYDIKENHIDETKYKSAQRVINGIQAEIFVEAYERFESKTVLDVRNSLIELKKSHDVKVLVLDYMDLINPGDGLHYGPKDERFRQQKVARLLKDLAVEQNVVIITFTQASSISPEQLNDPNFTITRFHLAEDKGKVRPADCLISINQTKDEKKLKMCRLYIDKAREHPGNVVITIFQNLAKSRFYDRVKTLNEILSLEEVEEE